MAKNFKIEVLGGAFDKNQQRATLNDEIKSFDGSIAGMNREVEVLDRYDDFAFPRIKPIQYKKEDGVTFGYGIDVNKEGGTHTVLWNPQKKAAEMFLKELRGYGLLADVVGSGKTYEACVVLSELAIRDKVNSLLIVAPKDVCGNWVSVLENDFGLGRGNLRKVKQFDEIKPRDCRQVGDFLSPSAPILVEAEDFAEWSDEAGSMLFDVVVFDEAHHLCEEEGKFANCIRLLSLMMQTKRRANKTYCLLLSATPHSGNLENMFRLWYFVRCKGGNPEDFRVQEDATRTAEYKSEKRYYKETVCLGATTVMEFINKVKLREVTNPQTDVYDAFQDYLEKKKDKKFNRKSEGEKLSVVEEFLSENEEIAERVARAVAGAYHNGVLRSIMIRQPNEGLAKKKFARNFLFFPMQEEPGKLQTKGLRGEELTVDLANLNEGKSVSVAGERFTLDEYIKEAKGNLGDKQAFAELVFGSIINKIGMPDSVFKKSGSASYYWDQCRSMPDAVVNKIIPYRYDSSDGFAHKMQKTKELLTIHADKRVLVFFDYEAKRDKVLYNRFEEELRKIPEFAARIMVGTAGSKEKIVETFSDSEHANAILIVKDASLTEGVNLQKANVIINFQITPDPLAMDQRIGRIFRLGQANDVIVYSLADMHALEGYALTYFSRIGLMSSNSGDATIIAGANNDRMVAVRCEKCQNVKLLSMEEYEDKKEKNELYCKLKDVCKQDDPERGTLMKEITTYDFKCDRCGMVFARSAEANEDGYRCLSTHEGDHGVMCSRGEKGDRSVYCSKICAMAHCKRFTTGGLAGKCAALALYRKDAKTSECKLKAACELCKYKSECPDSCRFGTGENAIRGCRNCGESQCHPKPHVIRFNDKWEAKCPLCDDGRAKLRPVVAKTFATYIRGAWNFDMDHGESFCANLTEEAKKAAQIKNILERDQSN